MMIDDKSVAAMYSEVQKFVLPDLLERPFCQVYWLSNVVYFDIRFISVGFTLVCHRTEVEPGFSLGSIWSSLEGKCTEICEYFLLKIIL